jgi:L-2-hydroxyglutarate oxidase LhgO
MTDSHPQDADVVLVGAGIMSMTLATFLKELQPHLKIEIVERLAGEAQESSGAWNNAGTGHAAHSGPTAASTSRRHWRSTSSSTCRGSSGRTSSRRARSTCRTPSSIPCRT